MPLVVLVERLAVMLLVLRVVLILVMAVVAVPPQVALVATAVLELLLSDTP
jgi:hypothetical protein